MKAEQLFQAADTAKKFYQQYLAIEQIAKALNELGSLEQAFSETRARVEKARGEEQAVLERIKAATSELSGIEANAEAKAKAIIDAANQKAKETAASSEALLQKAKDEAGRAEAAATAKINALTEQEVTTRSNCDAARKELEAIKAKVAAANATLLSLKERVSGL